MRAWKAVVVGNRVLCVSLALLLSGLQVATPAAARSHASTGTTITVNTTADDNTVDGNCSLREALQAADTDTAVDACPAGNGVDTIHLPAGRYTITHGSLEVHSTLTIDGDFGALIDGNVHCCTSTPTLHVNTGANVTLDLVSIQNSAPAVRNDGTFDMIEGSLDTNLAPWINPDYSNGLANYGTATLTFVPIRFTPNAIYNTGTLVAQHVMFDHNGIVDPDSNATVWNRGTMTMVGGWFARDTLCDCPLSEIYNQEGGSLSITRVRFADNQGLDVIINTGGLYVTDSAFDKNATVPIENDYGIVTVAASRLSTNVAHHSTPGGLLNVGGHVSIDSSTIDHNIGDTGGGIVNSHAGHLTLTNDTIVDNVARFDSGSGAHLTLPSGAVTNADGTAMIRNATIAGNAIVGFHDWPYHAGGVVNMPLGYTALSNTIISDNTAVAPVLAPDCFGTFHSLGYNLVEHTTDCQLGPFSHNRYGLSAALRPLADNGGPTMTEMPPWDSLVVDLGNPATPNANDATTC